MSERELRNMKKTMVSYVQEVGRALEKRFSDESFYADQCSFIEPLKRNFFKRLTLNKSFKWLIVGHGST